MMSLLLTTRNWTDQFSRDFLRDVLLYMTEYPYVLILLLLLYVCNYH